MAFMSQEKKAKLAPKIKQICDKHGVKATLGVQHHSTLVLNVRSGKIDFIDSFNRVCGDPMRPRPAHLPFQPAKNHLDVNPYWYHEHFDGAALNFLKEVIPAMNEGNHDRSDISTDYFDVGWYISIHIGKWDRPYLKTS